MRKAPLRRIGKVGKANIEARKRIAQIAKERNLTYCEIQLGGCLGSFPLAPAHRHKRSWYHGDANKLADPRQWVAGCQSCHDRIEHDPELTEAIFMRLRGPE